MRCCAGLRGEANQGQTRHRGFSSVDVVSGKSPSFDQYTYLGVDISNYCSWDARIAKVIGKGKAHVGKMGAILADSLLDPLTLRLKMFALMIVIVPKLGKAGGVWEGSTEP